MIAFGPTGQSLPESMATWTDRKQICSVSVRLFLRPCHSAATIRGSGT
jgi:hypothetical protein